MQFSVWHFYLILLLLHTMEDVSACSPSCSCKWKNGKQTAECSSKNLTEIPEGMDPETQVLEFSSNDLQQLPKELFVRKHLLNLQRLYLANCKLRTIHKDTFKGLTNLVEMDLSHNLLEAVPTAAFMNCPSLMKLTLSSNPVGSVKKLAFNHLSYLNTLELSGCEIAEIEEGAFQGLHSLEWLHLDSNRLRHIKGHTLPENLKEPICMEPPRLKGSYIKAVKVEELACLPDVSPTTFYLELGEGKNISLLCHIRAIPEATVSWWFEGQLLQNNSKIAPGVHLVYYIEEGTDNKRSELFIYNANVQDNGTFICSAENNAGTTQSNFTIRIILKEDPVVIIVSFPLDYLLILVAAVSVFALVTIIIVTLCLVRCHRKTNREKKRSQTKEAALHLQNNQNTTNGEKANWANKTASPRLDQQLKLNNLTPVATATTYTETEEVVLYGIRHCDDPFNSGLSPVRAANRNQNQIVSPSSLRRYQLEQNPDLINGTESIGCRREGDGEDGRMVVEGVPHPAGAGQGMTCLRAAGGVEIYTGDNGAPRNVRHIVDREGYPLDYGLPKMPCSVPCNEAYYRTLPCSRMKRHSAANPLKRYSREVEFLSRSVDSPYDHYHTDIRYTADGYPVRQQVALPSADTTPPSSLPCCSAKWPPYLPANPQNIPSVSKRSASAQTDTEDECDSVTYSAVNKNDSAAMPNAQNVVVNEVLTESPDEGYEGEPSVV
ncbi:leucine-rich repeat-containing protein 24-like isoform X2 [Cylas formicarius]|uniref:leucine-rich repeat-containing protein 24-like isoform X2 n=1 Tax=Cylas formicarius TaxID=197179 RepID=UPI00295876F1|nr:leucine-rich repeat-containing protein 24-like isoform X2 [Cylas formicarius]